MNNQKGLINAFENLKSALKTCNVEELDNMIWDGYRGFTLNGTIEVKGDILMVFKPGGIKLSTYEVSDVTYEVFSEIGIVSGTGVIAGSFGEHTFYHKVLFIDIFKYMDSDWRYFKSQVTEVPSTLA